MDTVGPDFMCIGAPKAGTTWLTRHICDHPDLYQMPIKELRYFGDNPWSVKGKKERMGRMLQNRKNTPEKVKNWYLHWSETELEDDDWYLNLFKIKEGKLAGDFTPSYCVCDPERVKKIKSVVGDIPILLSLRDPIERDWSQIKFTLHQQRKLDYVDNEKYIQFVDSKFCHSRSDYSTHINLWSKFFSKFHVIYLDDIKHNPEGVLKECCNTLNVEFNSNYFIKNPLFKPLNTTKETISYQMPDQVYQYLKTKHRKTIITLAQRYGGPPKNWMKKHYSTSNIVRHEK